jgi:uncharacterized membrane protein
MSLPPRDKAQSRLTRVQSNSGLGVVQQNIDELLDHERRTLEQLPAQERLAERVTFYSGTPLFLYLNVILFVVWIVWNLGYIGLTPFDPFPFGFLTMIVSLEAIVLAILVLLTQNRMQTESDRRTELDVQVNLLTEYEITQLLKLTAAIAAKLDCPEAKDPELQTGARRYRGTAQAAVEQLIRNLGLRELARVLPQSSLLD